ncbi:hypothetical protein GBN33_13700 [Plesiomonas shigelloides]|uniref:MvaI/BcnI family restriction endonuclease n=1 Tax=Plesiomonas shigelloides TaxID=703 RepID=UPI0012620F35|nr:MvaI/BcnI family restriction endonuclease [Plesiomonas shigelloides]KAB7696323.1 hypothetical protein GBN33_13700 [Plesiomonas shigelloides]
MLQASKFDKNKRVLSRLGIDYAIFQPTETGLNKCILDATHPVRTLFKDKNFHNYYRQNKGTINKIFKIYEIYQNDNVHINKLSLYRPETKNGDPRMWFRGLSNHAQPNDYLAVIIFNSRANLINLSRHDLDKSINDNDFIGRFLLSISEVNDTATELLLKLRAIAGDGWFKSQRSGDTGIGYTIETLLGKAADSSKKPDYNGIELKSGRDNKNRTTLFAQVADWRIPSCCNSSAEIVDRYGYQRDDGLRLYCTISAKKENPQGLRFFFNAAEDQLEEWFVEDSTKKELVAAWPSNLLRERLLEKHAETFWIEAETKMIDGCEFFKLKSITHTRAPLVSQLMPLISDGIITMDHLIKRKASNNQVTEKGPLFKISKTDLDLLFPEPKNYVL